MVGSDVINVYEPNVDDVDLMMEFQEEKLMASEDMDNIEITGVEMIKLFFPTLTDIKGLEDLTDEEIQKVIEEPSVAFLQVEQIIAQIIAEVYKTMIIQAKTKVLESDFAAESHRVEGQILDAAFANAAKSHGVEDVLNRINEQDSDLMRSLQMSLQSQDKIHQEVREGRSDDKITILSSGKSEEEVLKELEEENPSLKAQSLYDQYKKILSR